MQQRYRKDEAYYMYSYVVRIKINIVMENRETNGNKRTCLSFFTIKYLIIRAIFFKIVYQQEFLYSTRITVY